PLAYNSDLQEDKEALFDAVDTVLGVLRVMPPMLETMRFDREQLAEAAIADYSLATDAADLLARNGVPFREAHEVVGRLVGGCVEDGITFGDLTEEEWGGIHPFFARRRPPLTAWESVSARDVPGGTAPGRVKEGYAGAVARLGTARAWLEERQRQLGAVMRRGATRPPLPPVYR